MDPSPLRDTKSDLDFESSQPLWLLLAAITGVDDEHERVRLAATGIPSLLRCSMSGIAVRNEDDSSWVVTLEKEGQELPASDTQDVVKELEPLIREAIDRAGLMITCLDSESSRRSIPPSLRAMGIGCLAVAPLQTLHNRFGVVLVGRADSRALSREDNFILRALAEQLALGIENLRLHQAQERKAENLQTIVNQCTMDLRESEKRQRVLLEINNAIISNLDEQVLFESIARALGSFLSFDRASLTLRDPESGVLKVHALTGISKDLPLVGTQFPGNESPFLAVVESQRPAVCLDLKKNTRFPLENRLLKEGIRSYVSVPLIVKRRAIGTLNFLSRTPSRYSEADGELLTEVAKQVALAVENMFAYEEISRLKAQLEQENLYLQEEIKTEHNFEEIIGQSAAIKEALKAVEIVAPTDASVLITGETGTGKELIARAIHSLSSRAEKPLVKVNCAAVPAGLVESEFFGHEAGAFTGALRRRIGRFELADGGTIFLDEVGEISLALQPTLLRVLQEGEFERVGGARTIRVNVRVIAATNRNLQAAVQEGKFRADLYYRLNVFPLQVPPLRERREDIPLLVRYFAAGSGTKLGKKVKTLHSKAMEALRSYSWPGNIRELAHVVERGVILSQGTKLKLGGWLPQPAVSEGKGRISTLDEVQREHILSVLDRTGWRVSGEKGAARILGMKPTTLEARMKKLGIRRNR